MYTIEIGLKYLHARYTLFLFHKIIAHMFLPRLNIALFKFTFFRPYIIPLPYIKTLLQKSSSLHVRCMIYVQIIPLLCTHLVYM